jgi:hypothetical protein
MALYIFSDAHLGSGSDELEARKVAKIALLFERVKQDGSSTNTLSPKNMPMSYSCCAA